MEFFKVSSFWDKVGAKWSKPRNRLDKNEPPKDVFEEALYHTLGDMQLNTGVLQFHTAIKFPGILATGGKHF